MAIRFTNAVSARLERSLRRLGKGANKIQKTNIEWVKNPDGTQGYSNNPIKGMCPVGCSYCYARKLYKRFKWDPEIRFDVQPLLDIEKIKKPSRIFVGSTIELFGEWVDASWLDSIFRTVKENPLHTFIFLTKRPKALIKWNPFPENCEIGATADDYYTMFKATRWLPEVKANIKFLSFEPLLGSVMGPRFNLEGIDKVIIGQITPVKQATMPKLEWVEEIVEACDKAGVKVFLKNNLRSLLPCESPYYLKYLDDAGNTIWKLRQELPNA